jgi:hypothetical protein
MNNKENYRKIALECAVCKTKFEIWISIANYSSEVEEHIRKNFHFYCPVCKALEELEKNK